MVKDTKDIEEGTEEMDENSDLPLNGVDDENLDEVLEASHMHGSADLKADPKSDQKPKVTEVELVKKEAQDNHERYLRALADFENYKKRAIRERSELLRYQGESVFSDLLEVVDNLERAVMNRDVDKDQLLEGIEMIYKQFQEVLSRHNVKGESAVGKPFNPEIHQALSQVPSNDHKPGSVVSELKKPYFYKDKLIRVGQVVVAAEKTDG